MRASRTPRPNIRADLGDRLRPAPDEHQDEDDDQDQERVHVADGTPRRWAIVPGVSTIEAKPPLLVYGPALRDVRLRAGPSADTAPVRHRDLAARDPRGRAESRSRAGHRRGARMDPRAGLHRGRQGVLAAAARRVVAAGIGPGDTPAFAGMHEASASVAGGSLRAMEAILRGEVAPRLPPGRRAAPRDARARIGLLRVRRPRARDRPRPPRRAASHVHRPRRPSRRRRPGDPLVTTRAC